MRKGARKMYVFWGVIILAAGLVMAFAPEKVYDFKEGWKNDSDADPSPEFLLGTRIGGIVFALVGIAACVSQFLNIK